jgi:hypothetical protein
MPAKRKAPYNGRKQKRTARLNMMIEPWLKKEMHQYARRHCTSISTIVTDQFISILNRESEPDVEQI